MARMTGKVRMSESDKCSEKKCCTVYRDILQVLGFSQTSQVFLYLFLAEHRNLFSISCLKFFDE